MRAHKGSEFENTARSICARCVAAREASTKKINDIPIKGADLSMGKPANRHRSYAKRWRAEL